MKDKIDKMVSIIVPVYNVEKYLEQCINSIINQTYKNIEIILIDDGSTDNSGIICDEYAKKDNRIKVIHKDNEGISATRNRGIDESSGKYISFVDSDDYIEKNMIEILYKDIEKENADIAVCNYIIVKDKNNIKKDKNNSYNVIILSQNDALRMCFCNEFEFYLWNKIFKKTLFNEIKFPKGKNSEERYTLPKLIDNSKKIIYDNRKLYYYRIRKNSIIHSNEKINYDAIEADSYLLEYMKVNHKNLENISMESFINTNFAIYNKMYIMKCKDKNKYKLITKNIKENYTKEIKKSLKNKLKIKITLFLRMRCIYNMLLKIKNIEYNKRN